MLQSLGGCVARACGRSLDRVPAGADTKETFADVGDLLTTSFSARLSKDRGSIHTIQSQEQHSLQTPYTLEMDLGLFTNR